jgi:hypothetical protein
MWYLFKWKLQPYFQIGVDIEPKLLTKKVSKRFGE